MEGQLIIVDEQEWNNAKRAEHQLKVLMREVCNIAEDVFDGELPVMDTGSNFQYTEFLLTLFRYEMSKTKKGRRRKCGVFSF